jgi:mRNA-degrading endonuclease RelE of RelBE toxin-antitoxin system
MAAYNIYISKSAIKEIKELSKDLQTIINDNIASLSLNPYPNGYKKLKGSKNLLGHRKDIYEKI